MVIIKQLNALVHALHGLMQIAHLDFASLYVLVIPLVKILYVSRTAQETRVLLISLNYANLSVLMVPMESTEFV